MAGFFQKLTAGALHHLGLQQWSTPSLGCFICRVVEHCQGATGDVFLRNRSGLVGLVGFVWSIFLLGT